MHTQPHLFLTSLPAVFKAISDPSHYSLLPPPRRRLPSCPSAPMAAPPEPAAAAPCVHIEAVQTVTPMRAGEMVGKSRRIASAAPLSAAALAGHFRLVLYYKRAREEDSAWAVAGWLKDSLNAALSEDPLLAGRLRRRDDDDDAEGLEVRLNDAGVRLVQAQAEVSMAEVLAAEDRAAKEAHLAHWVDVDQANPQFSAPFHVQVTSFQDDGYSIGISCSLLLADPLFLSLFLHKWAQIHTKMQAQGHLPRLPIFYLGNFRRAERVTYLKSTPMDSVSRHTDHRTVLFNTPVRGADEHAVIAAACLKDAARRVEIEVGEPHEFSFIATGGDRLSELVVDESCVNEHSVSCGYSMAALNVVNWDELHCEELVFGEGSKPVQVSYGIVVGGDRPIVVVMPSVEEGGRGLISVTFPNKV